MAASTLHTLLIKLGFDVSGLQQGGSAARSELASVGSAANQMASMASNGATAVASLAAAERMAAAAAGPLVEGLSGASGAIAATSAATGPLVSGLAGAEGAISGIASTSGRLVAGLAGANGAIEATVAATGPLVSSTEALAEAMAAASRAAGPLVSGLAGARGAIAATAPVADLSAIGFEAVGSTADEAGPPITRAGMAAQGAASGLGNVPGPAMRAAGALKEVAAAADMAANRGSFMNRTLSMAFAFSGGVAVTNLFGFVANALIGFNSRLEQAHIAFTTLLGDSSLADTFIKKMEAFANVTPFEFPGLEDAVQRLMAMGFAADDVLPTLRAVGDAVAGLGGSQDKLDRITIALGQMATAGRVTSQDMRQLTEAGIPAWQMLATAIGKTVGETRKMAENGLIPSDRAIGAILKGMEDRFGGMMARQARTAQGAFSTIHDAAIQAISGAVAPLFDLLTTGMVAIADFFVNGGGKYVAPVIYAIGTAIAVALIPRLWGVAAGAMAASISIGAMTVPILPLIALLTALGIAWQEDFGGMRTTLGPIINGLFQFAGAVLQAAAGTGLLLPVLEALVVLIGVRFVASLTASAAGMLWNAGTALILGGALEKLSLDAGVAAVSTGGLSSAMGGLVAILGGVGVAAIGVWIAAIALLILNFDRVNQGVRVLALTIVGSLSAVVDAAASIPIVGEAFKGVAAVLHGIQNGILADMAAWEAEINRKAKAANGALGGVGAGLEDPLKDLKGSFNSDFSDITLGIQDFVKEFGTSMEGVNRAAAAGGGDAMLAMAKGITDHQNAPLDALKTLHTQVRNALSPSVEIARLIGMSLSEDLQAGLASNDPAVYAQAVATKKLITDRLDELTGGAYSAGKNTTGNIAKGMADSSSISDIAVALGKIGTPIAEFMDHLSGNNMATTWLSGAISKLHEAATSSAALSNVWDEQYKPSADAVADAMKGVNDQLDALNKSGGLSALNSAFSAISQAANRFFSEIHNRNLQAISDALKHRNAILDVKEALNQAPVTAMQKALDFQRRQIEEWRLRKAITEATDPASRRDAILALQDFLAQAHIDDMQAEVDAANAQIEQQKKANEAKAEQAKRAEDLRYQRQQDDFERQLELLRRYLAKHPGEWDKTNQKVLALLKSFGIDYKNAGSLLGASFVEGLREQVAAAQAAAKALADSIPYGPGSTTGSSTDEYNYYPKTWPTSNATSGYTQQSMTGALPQAHVGGGGTIVVMVGDQKLGEVTDQRLAIQSDIYGTPTLPSAGSLR